MIDRILEFAKIEDVAPETEKAVETLDETAVPAVESSEAEESTEAAAEEGAAD